MNVDEHPLFERDGYDLYLSLPLNVAQAALGAVVKVPTLGGEAELDIPAGTQSGQRFRLRGKGIAHLNSGRRGDQLVQVVRHDAQIVDRGATAAVPGAVREPGSGAHRRGWRRQGLVRQAQGRPRLGPPAMSPPLSRRPVRRPAASSYQVAMMRPYMSGRLAFWAGLKPASYDVVIRGVVKTNIAARSPRCAGWS